MRANTIIPTILVGGTVLGLLAATEVNTRMKAAPEPAWRVAAREAAMNAVSYAFVDSGPSDLSPSLPWIGTWSDGSVALFPEDLHRAPDLRGYEPAPYPATDLAAAEDSYAPLADDFEPRAAAADTAPPQYALERSAARAAEVAAALPSVGREVYAQGKAQDMTRPARITIVPQVQPATLDVPMPEPMFPADSIGDEEDRLGG